MKFFGEPALVHRTSVKMELTQFDVNVLLVNKKSLVLPQLPTALSLKADLEVGALCLSVQGRLMLS